MAFGDFVQAVGGVSNTTSPLHVAYGSNNAAGNILVVAGRINANAVPTVTDSQNNIWVVKITNFSSPGMMFYMAYSVNCKAGANTVTVTSAGNAVSGTIGEYVGLGIATFDKSNFGSSGSGTTWSTADSGAITPLSNGALIVAGQGQGSASNPGVTAGAGYAHLTSDSIQVASLESQTQATAAAIHGIFTFSTAVIGGAGIFSFIPVNRNSRLLASDNFTSGSLASGWGAAGFVGTSIVAGSPFAAEPRAVDSNEYGQVWTGFVWPSNQTSEVTANLTIEIGSDINLMVRWSSGVQTGYLVQIKNTTAVIFKATNAVYTQIATANVVLNPGDIWTFQIVGSVISLFQNGTTIESVEDTTFSTGGGPGFAQRSSVSQADSRILSWRGYGSAAASQFSTVETKGTDISSSSWIGTNPLRGAIIR